MKVMTRFAALALLVALGPANAALYGLDPGFSTAGRYNATIVGSDFRLLAHLQRPNGTSVAVAFYDGDICPAGRHCLALLPFNAAGVMTGALLVPTNGPATFSKRQGAVVLDPVMIKAADIDSQGRIVVVGSEQFGSAIDFKVVRLLPNGQPDNTFDSDGVQTIDFHAGGANEDFAYGVSVDPSDHIVVVGEVQRSATDTDFGIARLNVDGSLDTSFMGTGKRTIPFDLSPSNSDRAVTVKASSTFIYVAGNASDNGVGRLAFAQLYSSGSYRNAFCPGACTYQGTYPSINSGRRVISYGFQSDTSDTLVSASVNLSTRKWVYAGTRLGPSPTFTNEIFVQTLDANGDYVNEGLHDGGFAAPYRVGGVRWLDENTAASDIVLTGVSGDLLFFAQGMNGALEATLGWGGANPDSSYFIYDQGSVAGLLPAQPSVDSAGRVLLGGSYRAGDAEPYSIHIARVAQTDTIFKNGFE
ncbi:MAG: delta-60 repeat domain-containing protein [Dokdonella sp.]